MASKPLWGAREEPQKWTAGAPRPPATRTPTPGHQASLLGSTAIVVSADTLRRAGPAGKRLREPGPGPGEAACGHTVRTSEGTPEGCPAQLPQGGPSRATLCPLPLSHRERTLPATLPPRPARPPALPLLRATKPVLQPQEDPPSGAFPAG